MAYPPQVRKSVNLHIQDGRHGLFCIFKIDVNAQYLFDLCDFLTEHPLVDYPT